jgi:hypothetical protein
MPKTQAKVAMTRKPALAPLPKVEAKQAMAKYRTSAIRPMTAADIAAIGDEIRAVKATAAWREATSAMLCQDTVVIDGL